EGDNRRPHRAGGGPAVGQHNSGSARAVHGDGERSAVIGLHGQGVGCGGSAHCQCTPFAVCRRPMTPARFEKASWVASECFWPMSATLLITFARPCGLAVKCNEIRVARPPSTGSILKSAVPRNTPS